jgi:hypothetical protein
MPSKPKETVAITKLITNQIILGKTTRTTDFTIINDPYMIIPGVEQLQIYPYDEAILGKKLDVIKVHNDTVIYSTEAEDKIKNIYLEDKMGLEKTDQSIIV